MQSSVERSISGGNQSAGNGRCRRVGTGPKCDVACTLFLDSIRVKLLLHSHFERRSASDSPDWRWRPNRNRTRKWRRRPSGRRPSSGPRPQTTVDGFNVRRHAAAAPDQKRQGHPGGLRPARSLITWDVPCASWDHRSWGTPTRAAIDSPQPATPQSAIELLRQRLRTRHYSYRTECTYVDWAHRFFRYAEVHNPASSPEIGSDTVRDYLTHLAVRHNVSASTQNQALSALRVNGVRHAPIGTATLLVTTRRRAGNPDSRRLQSAPHRSAGWLGRNAAGLSRSRATPRRPARRRCPRTARRART